MSGVFFIIYTNHMGIDQIQFHSTSWVASSKRRSLNRKLSSNAEFVKSGYWNLYGIVFLLILHQTHTILRSYNVKVEAIA